MDSLNYDVSNIIFEQLPALDKLVMSQVFKEKKPSQFQVSSELIASKKIKGNNGLIMRALATGEYEPCVLTMLSIQKNNLKPEHREQYERELRSDFNSYDENQRVDRLLMQFSRLPLP